MEKKTVAIHQPNFLPWLGYFHKMIHSDDFVFFDDVQFPRGKSFASRVLIKTPNGTQWLTVPVSGKGEKNLINAVPINDATWRRKTLKSLQFNYQKSDHFGEFFPGLSEIFNKQHPLLMDLNIDLIKFILAFLGVPTQFHLSSELCKGMDIKTEEKIIYILKELNAGTYISGAGSGSKRYLNEQEFALNNIKLIWQHFKHPTYPQLFGEFESNLSIIDLIFNCGKNDSLQILLDISMVTN